MNDAIPAVMLADKRLIAAINFDGPKGCWLWQLKLDDDGYGRVKRKGRGSRAHRYVFKLCGGVIPEGLHLDHLCKVRNCVNPAHLEPVTPRENVFRSTAPPVLNAAATECVNGHPFTEENIYRWPKKPHVRSCKTCRDEISRRVNASRPTCRQGHPYTDETPRDRLGRRMCMTCRVAAGKKACATRWGAPTPPA